MHRDAATTVFNIPELAECILLQLGKSNAWKQLFVVQRVNSTFQSIIRSSPDLRRTMHLEQPRKASSTKFTEAVDIYRKFFFNIEDLLYPFWTNTRPINRNTPSAAIAVSMNVSLYWSEQTPGVMISEPPSDVMDRTTPIERKESWRNLLVPYHPEHSLELHLCGYDVMATFRGSYTLGDLADEAIRAGKAHLGGLGKVMYYG
ncbi:hypothetical protein Slin15195_G090480 [Septoria linicola]|uniref:Uncharacterized protein n=1 Tax=Septoria linicola TaxID=215465 RepID=A0A9Q9AUP6_9PEZI|nr:hypothetical protein Slin15195_G090480 [Septoria linicola]